MIKWQRRNGTIITLDGKRLAECRRRRGWTQAEAAEVIGVSRQCLSYWETEATVPTLPRIARLRDVYGDDLGKAIKVKP